MRWERYGSGPVDWSETAMISLLRVIRLWCDGEVLRHSAALSCWHRKRAGPGSPREARVRLDNNWTGRVQFGSEAPWPAAVRGGRCLQCSGASGGVATGRRVSGCTVRPPNQPSWNLKHTHTHIRTNVMTAPWTPMRNIAIPPQHLNALLSTETTRKWLTGSRQGREWQMRVHQRNLTYTPGCTIAWVELM